MKLFFGEIIPDVKINDEEQQHIVKVLRMKEGEEIFVTDGKGNLAKGNLVFEGKKVSLNAQNSPDNCILRLHLPKISTELNFLLKKQQKWAFRRLLF